MELVDGFEVHIPHETETRMELFDGFAELHISHETESQVGAYVTDMLLQPRRERPVGGTPRPQRRVIQTFGRPAKFGNDKFPSEDETPPFATAVLDAFAQLYGPQLHDDAPPNPNRMVIVAIQKPSDQTNLITHADLAPNSNVYVFCIGGSDRILCVRGERVRKEGQKGLPIGAILAEVKAQSGLGSADLP